MNQDIDLCSLIEQNALYKMHYFFVAATQSVAGAHLKTIPDYQFSENFDEMFYQNFIRSFDWGLLS